MLKNRVIIAIFISVIILIKPSYAHQTSFQEIQDLPTSNQIKTENNQFNKNHWAYKTLENITKKYGLLIGKPEEKFNGKSPLTRNEAAIILVSLIGKIEDNQLKLTEIEENRLEILKNELKSELNTLSGRVDNLESSVATIKGNISKLEQNDNSAVKVGFGEKFQINGSIQAKYAGNIKKGKDDYASNFSIPVAEMTIRGKLFPHLSYATTMFPSRGFNSPAKGVLGDAYASTDIFKHHIIFLGQTRVPIGQEGSISPLFIDTVDKSQISRKFSDYRDTGIKIAGTWDYVDYIIGAYSGNRDNSTDTNTTMDIGGWLVLKPLYKLQQFGKLEAGSGFFSGRNSQYSHNTLSFYGSYKYKKYKINGEYAFKDGYNILNQKAMGWFINNSYYLTDKLQLLARFDLFDPNTKLAKNLISEYTLGSTYFLNQNNLKLQLNLIHVNDQSAKDSQRVLVQTQYMF